MTTFPILEKQTLDESQRQLWDELTLGHRSVLTGGAEKKRLPDLFNAWLQFPEFGQLMLQVADAVRGSDALTHKLRELIILTTSMLWGARVEYDFHVPLARGNGLADAVIEGIGRSERPAFSDESERIVYQASLELVRTGSLSDATREAVVAILGYRGLMTLIALVGLYSIVAFTSNACDVHLLDDFAADEGKLQQFFQGRLIGEYQK